MEPGKSSSLNDKTMRHILRRLGNIALGKASTTDESRLYDEVMSGSIPGWVHRKLFQNKLTSF